MSKPRATNKFSNQNQTLTQMGYVEVGSKEMARREDEAVDAIAMLGQATQSSDEDTPLEVTPPKKRAKTSDDVSVASEGTASLGPHPHGDVAFHFRVPYASIEDVGGQDQLHSVFGYTKFWYEKDYVELKLEQVFHRLKWWRNKHEEIIDFQDEMYGQDKINHFYHNVVNETLKIEDNIRHYKYVALNVLNREALASVLQKDKDDGIVRFMFHLIHAKKLSLYKAEWYVGFKTVTVFEKYGETKPYGEVSLEAGESFEWKKYEDMED